MSSRMQKRVGEVVAPPPCRWAWSHRGKIMAGAVLDGFIRKSWFRAEKPF